MTLENTDEKITTTRLSPDKWTLKEMIGHLIDSASNNHQRMVRLQYETTLVFPAYNQETWKNIEKVNSLEWKLLVSLWNNYNEFILHVVEQADQKAYGNVWLLDNNPVSLENLIADYYRHILTHVKMFEDRVKELGAG
jgi:hypothetical protein